MSARPRSEIVIAGLVVGPVALFALAYLWLALDHGTFALLGTVVHERGRYTLLETTLYTRHFLRELPVAVCYAAASVAALRGYGPSPVEGPSVRARALALAAALALILGSWLDTVRRWGADVAERELLQAHLNDDAWGEPGGHWGYHLLSTLVYPIAAVALALGLQRLLPREDRAGPGWLIAWVTLALALSLVWGAGARPFVDPRHLGHEAREAATHLSVTLPLSFAAVLGAGRYSGGRTGAASPRSRAFLAACAVTALALAALGGRALEAGALSLAHPGAPASALGAAHLYEHVLDCLFVALLSLALAPTARGRA